MPNKPIEISLARPADASGIGRVQYESWLSTYPNNEHGISRQYILDRLNHRTPESRTQRWLEWVMDPDVRIWVAKDGDEVIGFATALRRDVHEIGGSYILDNYQSQGIGSKLITKVIEWLGRDQDIHLQVISYNQKAIAAYKKFGFEVDGPYDDPQAQKLGMKPMPGFDMVLKARSS